MDFIKRKSNEKEFEHYYNMLEKYPLKDEVSYSILLHGKLLISKKKKDNKEDYHDIIKECFKIINEMKVKKIHASLIRFNEKLLLSYYELIKLNVRPTYKQWMKILRTVWFVSALVKARRQKFILRKMKKIKNKNSVSLDNFNETFNIHNLECLYVENRDPLIANNVQQGI
ncbi:conserved Plasmodium protein, unknown function [Plasmodium sp. gorilla clade G2]|uniref:conserved Plasmodium protein, unknown function n=1 Tax=Plasmodium sp. gorilla clade G2 TaxID=880535 RepID=UPI000D26DA45|nr:conserved Plasmodium protein, unknown function [Plasmodium sp. gorilla clade G2]SOV20127.1 conserved Plasmodium protein, unknown function [Plasmodium sp. gorilla clade G2]